MGVIYKSTSRTSNKSYIGQTTRNPYKRIQEHKLYINKYPKLKFYNAIRKYKWDDFDWEVLYYNVPKNQLSNMERWCIATYDTYYNGYNSTKGGEITEPWNKGLINPYSKETLQKMRDNHADFSGQNHYLYGKKNQSLSEINKSRKGIKMKTETKGKISKSQMGEKNHNYNKHPSNDTRNKMSTAKLGKSLSNEHKKKVSKGLEKYEYKIIKPNGEIELTTNVSKYCEVNNLDCSSMYKIAKGKKNNYKGYKCERIRKL